jgi:hypothetical protein
MLVKCPECRSPIKRSRRTSWERSVSFLLPLRRYKCMNPECEWGGSVFARRSEGISETFLVIMTAVVVSVSAFGLFVFLSKR